MRLALALIVTMPALYGQPAAAQFPPSPREQDGLGHGWGAHGLAASHRDARGPEDRDGQVDVATFRAEDPGAAALGHGIIALAATEGTLADDRDQAMFEAAVIDRLAAGGYDTATLSANGGQVAELRVFRTEAQSAETRRNPVSGAMEVGVGSHGTSTAMAIAVDLRKPRGALISTRMEVRIRDRASGTVLWEGRATMLTREGTGRWTGDAVPRKLASALFEGFHPTDS